MNYQRSLTIVLASLVLLLLNGCLSLDPFLFKGEDISSYKLDAYEGKTECSDAIAFLADSIQPITQEIALTSGKETIYAILCRSDTIAITSADTIIVYFHGTGDHIDLYWPRTKLIFTAGYPVMVVDYRGYGKSSGEPTEKGIYEDGRAALDYIRTSLNNPQVIVYAYSLGSLVGCELASTDINHQIIRLILEAPIGSVETLIEDASYLNLPGSYVVTYKGDNAEKIKLVTVPLLWMHGINDETLARETNGLPVWNAYRSVNPGKGYYIVTNAKHRTNPQTIGYSRYIKCLREVIRDSAVKDPLLLSN